MSDYEEKREIKSYQVRQPELALTFEQAAFLRENDWINRFEEASFSVWEHLDYDYEIHRRILTPGQFEVFEIGWDVKRSRAIDGIRESDSEQAANVSNYYEPLRQYLLDHFWPDMSKLSLGEQILFCFPRDEAKYIFLRTEYRKWEKQRRADLVADHFRHCGRFSPLLFAALETKLDVEKLLPPHDLFYAQADEVTKTVYDFMRRRYDALHRNAFAEFREITGRYEAFFRERSSQPVPGWHVDVEDRRSPGEKRSDWCLKIALADVGEFFKRKAADNQPNPI